MTPSSREQRVIQIPTGYDPLIAPWVWLLEDTRRRTKAALAGLTTATLDWVPPEGGNNIGTLLYHLVVIELSYLYEDILQITEMPQELSALVIYDVRDAHGQLTVVKGEPLGIHLLRLDTGRGLLLNTLRTLTPTEFRRVRPVESYDITPEWALHHLMQHEAEHRGEIMALRQRAEAATPESV